MEEKIQQCMDYLIIEGISSYSDDGRVYIHVNGLELEISKDEIEYCAKRFRGEV